MKYCFQIACITYIPTSNAWWFQFLHILEIKLLAWLISLLKALGDKIFFQNHLFSWQNLVPCRFRAEFSFTCCVHLLGATCIPCHVASSIFKPAVICRIFFMLQISNFFFCHWRKLSFKDLMWLGQDPLNNHPILKVNYITFLRE